MLLILAQLCWLSFLQALRWCCCPQGDEPLKLSTCPPGVSHQCGLLHAPCPDAICIWASLTPLWPGPCRVFPCPSSSQRFSSRPSISFHSEMTPVCVAKKLISQVISPWCILHVFLLFSILLCQAVTFLAPLSPHQNVH